MIDIVIPHNQSSRWECNELRYTLRSFEMHFELIGNVYIIGHKPSFLQNVIHIPFREKSMYPAINIYQKLKLACETKEVSGAFIYAADDHFLQWQYVYDAAYYHGDLENRLCDPGEPIYNRTIRNTLEHLISSAEPRIKNFDAHTPMMMGKTNFLAAMSQVDWEKPWGYCIKSLYGNHSDLMGAPIESDGKIRASKSYDYLRGFIKDKVCLSSGPDFNDDFKKLLNELYPNKSKYEQ
jgi:hypothetical protein